MLESAAKSANDTIFTLLGEAFRVRKNICDIAVTKCAQHLGQIIHIEDFTEVKKFPDRLAVYNYTAVLKDQALVQKFLWVIPLAFLCCLHSRNRTTCLGLLKTALNNVLLLT